MSENPYDAHTLDETIKYVKIFDELRPGIVLVDKGYRGRAGPGGGMGRSCDQDSAGVITRTIKAMIKCLSAI